MFWVVDTPAPKRFCMGTVAPIIDDKCVSVSRVKENKNTHRHKLIFLFSQENWIYALTMFGAV